MGLEREQTCPSCTLPVASDIAKASAGSSVFADVKENVQGY